MENSHRVDSGAAVLHGAVDWHKIVQIDRFFDPLQRFISGYIQPFDDTGKEPIVKFTYRKSFEHIVVVE